MDKITENQNMLTAAPGLFSKNEVNTGRQFEADLAKAICIIGMVLVHCFEIINIDVAEISNTQYAVQIVLDCVFGAATFMFCMGLGIAYSRNNTPEGLIRRGGMLLFFAYLLNFVRSIPPYLFCYAMDKDPEWLLLCKFDIFNVDILHFAGLALMLFGLLKKLRLSDRLIGVIALAMSALASFFRDFTTGMMAPDQLIGLFLGTAYQGVEEQEDCFPLFTWFIFVVAGYFFALLLRRCRNKGRFYAICSPIAGAIVAIYLIIAIPNRLGVVSGDLNNYYHMTTIDAMVCICAAIAVLGLYYAVSHILGKGLKSVISVISKDINRIYCIHWVLLMWSWFPLQALTGLPWLTDPQILLYGVALFISSTLLARVYGKYKNKLKARSLQK